MLAAFGPRLLPGRRYGRPVDAAGAHRVMAAGVGTNEVARRSLFTSSAASTYLTGARPSRRPRPAR